MIRVLQTYRVLLQTAIFFIPRTQVMKKLKTTNGEETQNAFVTGLAEFIKKGN